MRNRSDGDLEVTVETAIANGNLSRQDAERVMRKGPAAEDEPCEVPDYTGKPDNEIAVHLDEGRPMEVVAAYANGQVPEAVAAARLPTVNLFERGLIAGYFPEIYERHVRPVLKTE